jgi:hypothetical protein
MREAPFGMDMEKYLRGEAVQQEETEQNMDFPIQGVEKILIGIREEVHRRCSAIKKNLARIGSLDVLDRSDLVYGGFQEELLRIGSLLEKEKEHRLALSKLRCARSVHRLEEARSRIGCLLERVQEILGRTRAYSESLEQLVGANRDGESRSADLFIRKHEERALSAEIFGDDLSVITEEFEGKQGKEVTLEEELAWNLQRNEETPEDVRLISSLIERAGLLNTNGVREKDPL